MIPVLSRWGLRHHARHPLRSGLAALGIAVGIGLLVSVQSTLHSATSAFEASADALLGKADCVVRGGPDGVPVEALATLATMPSVVAAPVVEGLMRAGQPAGPTVRYLGIDPFVEPLVRPWAAQFASRDEARSKGADAGSGIGRLVPEASTFAANRATIARLPIGSDGVLALFGGGVQQRASLVAELATDDAALDDVLLVDIATAQEWSGKPRRVDRIDVAFSEGADVNALRARLANSFPSLRVEEAGFRASFSELTAAFRSNLEALGLLALLVGAFLVHAAMRASVAKRQVEFALLSAIGGGAARIGRVVATEAIVLGLIGSMLGCAIGIAGAQWLVEPMVRSLNDHFATFSLHGVETSPWLLCGALVLGPCAALLASWMPMREAMASPPRAVFVQGRMPVAQRANVPWLALPLFAIGCAMLAFAGRAVAVAHGGMMLSLVGIAMFAPFAVERVLALAAHFLRRMGPFSAYVARSACAARSRVGASVAALVLAVGITTGIGAMVQSFRASVTSWLSEVIPADVYVSLPGGIDERAQGSLDPASLRALEAAVPAHLRSMYRPMRVASRVGASSFEESHATASSLSPRTLAALPLLEGGDEGRAAFLRGDGVIATEPLAARLSLRVGSTVEIATDDGVRSARVVGIERHYRNPRGEWMLPLRWFPALAPESMGLECNDGETAEQLEARVRNAVRDLPQSLVTSTRESIERTSMKVFDRTFAITDALRLLCIAIAALGIWSSFLSLQLDRQQEIGILRALGATPGNAAFLVLGQTALLGAAAGLLALPVGAFLGYVLSTVINRGSFGWTLQSFVLPSGLLVDAIALALASATCAGLWPAWKIARMAPAAALREE